MELKKQFTFALVGNPNAGKSSVFNQLTGLRQKVGNFPGVTVDKKVGTVTLPQGQSVSLIDLPGAYSLYPNAQDERVVLNILANPADPVYPHAVVYVADLTQFERHSLLLTQLKDLGFPLILAINMIDLADKQHITLDKNKLSETLALPIILLNGRTGGGIEDLKMAMFDLMEKQPTVQIPKPFYQPTLIEKKTVEQIRLILPVHSNYAAILWAHHFEKLPFLSQFEKNLIKKIVVETGFEDIRLQITETLQRFNSIQPILQKNILKKDTSFDSKNAFAPNWTDKIDKIVTHNVLGPLIFFAAMFFLFQAVFSWATPMMDFIEGSFAQLNILLKKTLPNHWLSALFTEGIIAGLSGVLVFIPQIAILFFLISVLEEIGYMARAVYLFDRVMQRFGLNGRSIVALISGGACAIPAIMSTRTIGNPKERLITILVTPLISCSARIPVYALLIGFVVPPDRVWGIFNLQGVVFAGLYLLSAVSALGSAWVFKKIIKNDESAFLAMELPEYRMPLWKNIRNTVIHKVLAFITEAGKIILMVSIVLWFLASFGPSDAMSKAAVLAEKEATEKHFDASQTETLVAARKTEASYAGLMGRFMEPAIRPLGFDWKIGIALISSFAAREVFVGTMSTIYSVGSNSETSIREKMRQDRRKDGTPVYTIGTAVSLLIFYVFAMQCMSTMAVVRRETGSWKWVWIQFAYMSVLAYFGSFLAYQLF
jgi:ferrous iron transport protein B